MSNIKLNSRIWSAPSCRARVSNRTTPCPIGTHGSHLKGLPWDTRVLFKGPQLWRRTTHSSLQVLDLPRLFLMKIHSAFHHCRWWCPDPCSYMSPRKFIFGCQQFPSLHTTSSRCQSWTCSRWICPKVPWYVRVRSFLFRWQDHQQGL